VLVGELLRALSRRHSRNVHRGTGCGHCLRLQELGNFLPSTQGLSQLIQIHWCFNVKHVSSFAPAKITKPQPLVSSRQDLCVSLRMNLMQATSFSCMPLQKKTSCMPLQGDSIVCGGPCTMAALLVRGHDSLCE